MKTFKEIFDRDYLAERERKRLIAQAITILQKEGILIKKKEPKKGRMGDAKAIAQKINRGFDKADEGMKKFSKGFREFQDAVDKNANAIGEEFSKYESNSLFDDPKPSKKKKAGKGKRKRNEGEWESPL
jgi:hypothetical protein